jgi:hypothetical protein
LKKFICNQNLEFRIYGEENNKHGSLIIPYKEHKRKEPIITVSTFQNGRWLFNDLDDYNVDDDTRDVEIGAGGYGILQIDKVRVKIK